MRKRHHGEADSSPEQRGISPDEQERVKRTLELACSYHAGQDEQQSDCRAGLIGKPAQTPRPLASHIENWVPRLLDADAPALASSAFAASSQDTGESNSHPRHHPGAAVKLLVGALCVLGLLVGVFVAVSGQNAPKRTSEPALSALILAPSQVGAGYTAHVIPGGQWVEGQVTLDLCGQGFASEAMRLTRLQEAYAKLGSAPELSNELVRYQSGWAQQAIGELHAVATHCPAGPQNGPAQDEQGISYKVAQLKIPGLLAGSLALKITASKGAHHQTMYEVYQARGDYLSGVYVAGGMPAQALALLEHAAWASAVSLTRVTPISEPLAPFNATSTYTPQIRSAVLRACNDDAYAMLHQRIAAAGQVKLPQFTKGISDYCSCALRQIEVKVPAQQAAQEMLAAEEAKGAYPAYVQSAAQTCLAGLRTAVSALNG